MARSTLIVQESDLRTTRQALIIHPDLYAARSLIKHLKDLGYNVWQATAVKEACTLIDHTRQPLVVIDLHFEGEGLEMLLDRIRRLGPDARILLTAQYPDPERELMARQYGARAYLQQPFTRAGLEQALENLHNGHPETAVKPAPSDELPTVRVPLRIKLTFPYLALALALAMAAGFVVSRAIINSAEQRFDNQLIATGKLVNERLISEEEQLLESVRLLISLDEVAEAAAGQDAERLRELALFVALNASQDAVAILDANGQTLVSLQRRGGPGSIEYDVNRGDWLFQDQPFVQAVLEARSDGRGDKYAGLFGAPSADYFYVAGPLHDDTGALAGAVLVGRALPNLLRQIKEATLSEVTLYDTDGQLAVSTLFAEPELTSLSPEQLAGLEEDPDRVSLVRDLCPASVDYREIIGSWQARGDLNLGYIGVALPQLFLIQTRRVTGLQIFLLVLAATLLVIVIGVALADRITTPLLRIISAFAEVAKGNLEVKVEPSGNDEVAILAYSFNSMISSLREGHIYRDLLGRSVSPEVREQLRRAFASGDLNLAGYEAIVTVLASDIRNFTALVENEDPAVVLEWLNEYYGEVVPIINRHSGLVNDFGGEGLSACFGILPRPMSAQESARQAFFSALEMLAAIDALNERRIDRGELPLVTGIGINTGLVKAGSLGTGDRLRYIFVGEAVHTARRLPEITRHFGDSCAVFTGHSLFALGERHAEFEVEEVGNQMFKEKGRKLMVFRLLDVCSQRSGERA